MGGKGSERKRNENEDKKPVSQSVKQGRRSKKTEKRRGDLRWYRHRPSPSYLIPSVHTKPTRNQKNVTNSTQIPQTALYLPLLSKYLVHPSPISSLLGETNPVSCGNKIKDQKNQNQNPKPKTQKGREKRKKNQDALNPMPPHRLRTINNRPVEIEQKSIEKEGGGRGGGSPLLLNRVRRHGYGNGYG